MAEWPLEKLNEHLDDLQSSRSVWVDYKEMLVKCMPVLEGASEAILVSKMVPGALASTKAPTKDSLASSPLMSVCSNLLQVSFEFGELTETPTDNVAALRCVMDMADSYVTVKKAQQSLEELKGLEARKKWVSSQRTAFLTLSSRMKKVEAWEDWEEGVAAMITDAQGLKAGVSATVKEILLEALSSKSPQLQEVVNEGQRWKEKLTAKPTWSEVTKAGKALTPDYLNKLKVQFSAIYSDLWARVDLRQPC